VKRPFIGRNRGKKKGKERAHLHREQTRLKSRKEKVGEGEKGKEGGRCQIIFPELGKGRGTKVIHPKKGKGEKGKEGGGLSHTERKKKSLATSSARKKRVFNRKRKKKKAMPRITVGREKKTTSPSIRDVRGKTRLEDLSLQLPREWENKGRKNVPSSAFLDEKNERSWPRTRERKKKILPPQKKLLRWI